MADVNKSANKLLNDFQKNIMGNTNTCKLAKVVDFKPETYSCSVMPLPSEDNSIVLNVPVATIKYDEYLVYCPLKKDDIVLVVFCDYDADDILLGGDTSQTERVHDISDAFVVGGISLLNESLSLVDPDSLLIQNKSKSAYFKLEKDGKIEIKGQEIKVMGDSKVQVTSPMIDLVGYAQYKGREIAVKGDSDTNGDVLV